MINLGEVFTLVSGLLLGSFLTSVYWHDYSKDPKTLKLDEEIHRIDLKTSFMEGQNVEIERCNKILERLK